MKMFLVSSRSLLSAVWQDPIYELENLIAHLCDATIVAPRSREIARVAARLDGRPGFLARSLVRYSIGKYRPEQLARKTSAEFGFSVAMSAWDLQVFEAVRGYRERFDVLAGYVFDAWGSYPAFLREFDALFISLPEEVQRWEQRLGVRPSVLPFAADALGHSAHEQERSVDLLSYGRLPREYLAHFLERFGRPDSRHLFVRIEGRLPDDHPARPLAERADLHYYASLRRLLKRSKASLCFDTLSPGPRQFPHSVVTLRWYEAFAAGCVAVGSRPVTPEAERRLCWPEAHLDLPATPGLAADFLADLFEDPERLNRIRLRNTYYALTLHDWRHRLRDVFTTLGLAIPAGLRSELERLAERAELARVQAVHAGALDDRAPRAAHAG